jgi:1-acyl-sn-glycerol-3-phosphate acyltransferase
MPLSPDFTRTNDWFYRIAVRFGRFPMWATSRPLVMEAHHARRDGAFILASNHFSHYDFLALMRATPRRLDFVSIIEAFRIPFVGWVFAHMNAFPLDRFNRDPKTVRVILDRLAAGRVIAMYPEAQLRNETNSACVGGPFRPGVARIARLAQVPIVPVVVYGTPAYTNWINWLPLRRVRYGVIFGAPIATADEILAEQELRSAFQDLYRRLRDAMARE